MTNQTYAVDFTGTQIPNPEVIGTKVHAVVVVSNVGTAGIEHLVLNIDANGHWSIDESSAQATTTHQWQVYHTGEGGSYWDLGSLPSGYSLEVDFTMTPTLASAGLSFDLAVYTDISNCSGPSSCVPSGNFIGSDFLNIDVTP